MTKKDWAFVLAVHALYFGFVGWGLYGAVDNDQPLWRAFWCCMVFVGFVLVGRDIARYVEMRLAAKQRDRIRDAILADVGDLAEAVKKGEIEWEAKHNADDCVICQRIDKEQGE
jgi:hypothetical protein